MSEVWRREPHGVTSHRGICGVRLSALAAEDAEAYRCQRCIAAAERRASGGGWEERRARQIAHRYESKANWRGRTGFPDRRTCIVWIYALVDPRTMRVRYVGRTDNLTSRLATHLSPTASKRVVTWVSELRESGTKPLMMPLWAVDPGDDSFAAESRWYEHFSRLSGQERLLNAYRP